MKIFYVDGATTVCLLIRDGVVVARGLSICSRLDEFDPAEGRRQAYKRSLEAEGRAHDCCEIKLEEPRAEWMDKLHLSLARDRFGLFKGYYMPILTPTEYLILEAKKIGNGNNNESL